MSSHFEQCFASLRLSSQTWHDTYLSLGLVDRALVLTLVWSDSLLAPQLVVVELCMPHVSV